MLVAWVGQADPIVADVFGFSKRIRAGAPRTKTLCGERMRDPAHSPNSSQRSTAAQRERTRLSLYAADIFIARTALEAGDLGAAYQALENHLPAPGEQDIRDFEWHWLWHAARGEATARR